MINFLFIFCIFNFIASNKYFVSNKNKNTRNNLQILNSTKKILKKKNVILGVIQKYPLKKILPFFKSWQRVNFANCDMVIFIRDVPDETVNYLKSIGVLVIKIPNQYKEIGILNVRWQIYIDFLTKSKTRYNLVLHCDVRDVIFQKDLFKYYEDNDSFLGKLL